MIVYEICCCVLCVFAVYGVYCAARELYILYLKYSLLRGKGENCSPEEDTEEKDRTEQNNSEDD